MADVRSRPDKWYLGAGDGLCWTPPFPQWLDTPGFWDEAHLFQYPVQPLFTLSFVVAGALLAPRCRTRSWTPDALTLTHDLGRLRARETRHAPGGALVSAWSLRNPTRRAVTVDAIAWTALDGDAVASRDVHLGPAIAFVRTAVDRRAHRARIASRLSLTPAARSFAGRRAQRAGATILPRFELTPFWDRWEASGKLAGGVSDGVVTDGVLYLGLQRRLRIAPGGVTELVARLDLALDGPGERTGGRKTIVPGADFAAAPAFRCSDPFLAAHWRHRWYGLRLNSLAPGGAPHYRHPAVCEGIATFHVPISYSAPCHMRELRWLPDAARAQGVLRTFLDHQKPDGSLHGRIYADHLDGTDFYHGDWGGAVLALDAVHPDPAFLADVYPGLSRYGHWLLHTRDPDLTGMVDVVDQYETGQEYMSRYQAVDPEADRYGWENRIRLKGIDVTVYAYRLYRALAHLAAAVSPGDAAAWTAAAERSGRAVLGDMWDETSGMFFDVDPRRGTRTGVKAAVCFYPYLTDLTGPRHAAGFGKHLFDPREFWTPFPVPSSSVDDPQFDPDAQWKGARHNCPWNGRVWPMTNAHVVEALARVVRAHRPAWAPRLGELLRRFGRMMTDGGRADRPNCFEHYHPFTGRASVYRGIDDYQHSWLNDLIVSHVMGVLPHGPTGVTIHPLRLGFARAALDGLAVAGHRLGITLDARRFRVRVDGRAAGTGRVGEPLTIAF